jgi:hypothetical protein
MRSGALLWFGVLASPLAWVTQLVTAYGLEEAACSTGSGDVEPVLASGAEPAIAIVSIAAAVIALAGALAAFVVWRAAAADGEADPRGRIAFMAGAGLLGSLIFLAVIVLGGIALFPFDVCHAG